MNKRGGFTLIEVMVAVMIISVVIAALLQIRSYNTHFFIKLQNDQLAQRYITLLSGTSYGFENERITLDKTLDRFDIDDDLRRELKRVSVELLYQTIERIDFSKLEDSNSSSIVPMNLELGRTVLKLPSTSTTLVRIRLQ